MLRRSLLVPVLAALLCAPACKRADEKPDLPPASGEGAAPLPDLPKVPPVATTGSATGGSSVTPSEGKTTGTTYAHAEVQVTPQAMGTITAVHFNEGDHVKKGDLLVEIDPRDAWLRVQQAKAAVDGAKVQLSAAKVEYDRTKSLLTQDAASKMQMDQVQAHYDGARVGVEQAQAALAVAEKAVADCKVRAPMDGVVTSKLRSEGEMAAPPGPLLVLQDQDTLDLKFRLPEAALAHLKVGDPFQADFTAIGLTRDLTVARISPSVDARTRTVEITAFIPNKDGALRPGLLAEISLGADAAVANDAGHGGAAPKAPDPGAPKTTQSSTETRP